MMIDASFQPYSPGSRRLFELEDAGEQSLLAAEIGRTLAAFEAAASLRINVGRLTREEADAIAAVWRSIGEDLQAQEQWLAERFSSRPQTWTLADRLAWLRKNGGVPWADKVQALRREIETRRTGYTAQIDLGRLSRDQAKTQLELLEAVHDLYWRQGFAFDGTREECRANVTAILDADVEQQGAAAVAPAREAAA